MHYQVDDFIIESELAARSTKQRSRVVLDFILSLPSHYEILDYGCGKLRYSIPLAERVSRVVAIDSTYQLCKKQIINGLYITPKEYKQQNLFVLDILCDEWRKERYDVVFCTNVLSAIPNDTERLKILGDAVNVLKEDGYMYLVVQYRNSYFKQYNYRQDVFKHNDGWVIKRKNKRTFYGLVLPEKIVTLCKEVGFTRFDVKRHDGSCFIKAYLK